MTIVDILRHAPVWVVPLLLVLLARGLAQTVARRMTLRRATLPSLALAAVSLAGAVTTSCSPWLVMAAWAVGAALALALAGRAGLWRGIGAAGADGRVLVPGSWLPLALVLGLFGIKFGVGAALALQPELAAQPALASAAAATYGMFSGLFLSRARAAWLLAQPATPGRPLRLAQPAAR